MKKRIVDDFEVTESQPKVSALMRGAFSNFSERKLMDCLDRLGCDIEIKLKPATQPTGHLILDIA